MNLLYFISGDAPFFFAEQVKNLSWLPPVWDASNGLGQSSVSRLWVDYPFRLVVKLLSSVGFSWFIIEKLLWLSVLILVLYSSFRLACYILGKNTFTFLAPVIYAMNTYVLLLFSGGQIGVALAYGLSPLVLLQFIKTIDPQLDHTESIKYQVSSIKRAIQNGLLFALLIAFDLRLAYLVFGASILYLVLRIRHVKILNTLYLILYTIIVPLFIVSFTHMFWILPMILAGGGLSSVGEQFTSSGMLKFLSFADFSHAIALLHPNWPENLFGKVYFLQPEFLLLPLIAFSSLLSVNRLRVNGLRVKTNNTQPLPAQTGETRNHITYFVLLALAGVFFAKGVNPPFGGIYNWLFNYVPGFVMFRDPTKFYLYTAIGYSVLIPYAINGLSKRLRVAGYGLFILFWIFTLRAVFMGPFGFAQGGQINGNFRPLAPAAEHILLKDILVNDSVPSRTLWIPSADKFAYSSDIHPLLTTDLLFPSASVSSMIDIIKTPEFVNTIRDNGIGYVIVPQDLEKKIFLSDYTFDSALRENFIRVLNSTTLRSVEGFQSLRVYKSVHDPMVIQYPLNLDKLQYWANIGVIISIFAIIVSLILLK